MNQTFNLKLAMQKGEAAVSRFGIASLPVDPFELAARHEITVEAKPDAEEGVSGMLLRHGNTFGILYATHITNEGFQHFSIAHELGHYFLDGHIDHIFRSGVHVSTAGFISADPYELEADHFAAGLLMPSQLFMLELQKYEPGLKAIESLARLCRTSLTATAIRYAQLSEDAVAIVVSTSNVVDYCYLSETMKSIKDLIWLKKGDPVPKGTITYNIGSDTRRVAAADQGKNTVDIVEWFGVDRSIKAQEEAVGLGRYSKTLTVLTCESIVDPIYEDDDQDDEAMLGESWTPRFRR